MSDPTTNASEAAPLTDGQAAAELAELRRLIAAGFDVEAFMRTDIGKYFQARASRELEDAQDALVEADASDVAAVRELQLQARVAARVLTYFADIVRAGEAAEARHAQAYEHNGNDATGE